MLEGILSSGNAAAIDAITRNLYAFDMLVHSSGGRKVEDFKVRRPEEIEADIARAIEESHGIREAEGRIVRKPRRRAG